MSKSGPESAAVMACGSPSRPAIPGRPSSPSSGAAASSLFGSKLHQDGRYVIRLRAAGFKHPYAGHQLVQKHSPAQIAMAQQFSNPGLAEKLPRRVHRFSDAVGNDEELVSRRQ